MSSIIKVDTVQDQDGNNIINENANTVTVGKSGDTVNIVGTLQNNGAELTGDISSVVAGTGLSGGGTTGDVTLNVEAAQSGITSLGTITGFTSTGIDDNATSTAITIDSSENVGIGITNPTYPLQVYKATSGDIVRLGSVRTLDISNSDNGAYVGAIWDRDINSAGGIHTYSIEGNEKIRILPTGGITFNGDTAQANALDDYEEGSFTPAYAFDSGSVTMSGGSRGEYVKIGNLVHFQIYMATDNTSSPSGDTSITGLPFTTGDENSSTATIGLMYRFGTDFDGDSKARVSQDGTTIQLFKNASSSTSATRIQGGDFYAGGNTSWNNLHIAGCYSTR